ncbi:GDSL esterase/lipase [Camellia lanceoleosa]|uniref:GDSL esterase/lipase n=1 Tax=Camellia lanceoleosa TaxID=1840588 RepID=A0ACC0I7P1_9ERIC|nr:GDSL esterase/lipase [Camellia lanceoleosa]
MLGLIPTFQGAQQEQTFLSMASTLPTQDQLGGSAMASTVLIFSTLYNFGARKFGIIGVLPIGCCPARRVYNATGGCLEGMNNFARAFHFALDTLMRKISSELPEMKYSLGNTHELIINVIQNPSHFNLKDVETACCGAGRLNAEIPCNVTSNLCVNRKEYLFWDMCHPTQTASQLVAVTLYDGPPRFVTPINFHQLADDN